MTDLSVLEERWRPAFEAFCQALPSRRHRSCAAVYLEYLGQAGEEDYGAWLTRRGLARNSRRIYQSVAQSWRRWWEEAGGPSARSFPEPSEWGPARRGAELLEGRWRELYWQYAGLLRIRHRDYRVSLGCLVRFLDWLGAQALRLEKLSSHDLAAYFRGLGHLSPGRRNHCATALRNWFSFLARQALLSVPDVPRVRYARIGSARALSREEVRQLLLLPDRSSALGLRDAAWLELGYGSGLRLREVGALNLSDVDLGQGWVWVRQGKGERDRLVPLGTHALAALREYLEKVRPRCQRDPRESALWLGWQTGRRWSAQSFSLRLREVYQPQLDFRLHFHRLRHSCATHLLEGGMNVESIRQLLGHSSLTTTMTYTQVSVRELQRVHRRCHPRG